MQAFVGQLNAARPDLYRTQSCPRGLKYVNNPWQDYIVDNLRTRDTRWGYNAKPTRTAADNGGVPVVAAGDEVAYHYGAGADQGSTDVYLIDLLEGHCGANPVPTYRNFTGEEPGRWTGAGRFYGDVTRDRTDPHRVGAAAHRCGRESGPGRATTPARP